MNERKYILIKHIRNSVRPKMLLALDEENSNAVFQLYIRFAFPRLNLKQAMIIQTYSALNSLSGILVHLRENGQEEKLFVKIPINSTTNTIDAHLAKSECDNSNNLSRIGWPVVKPLMKSENKHFPALLFPYIDNYSLFDRLSKMNDTFSSTLSQDDITKLSEYYDHTTEISKNTLFSTDATYGIKAPIQQVFLERYKRGGRIDLWYADEALIKLPNNDAITWREFKKKKWVINGSIYRVNLEVIIERSKNIFSYNGEHNVFLHSSHSDDHSANLFMSHPVIAYDCAYSGFNPVSLDVKALANTGFLLQSGMYYVPQELYVNYMIEEDRVVVQHNIYQTPLNSVCEVLAKQIIDHRTIPLFKKLYNSNADLIKEVERFKCGLTACALSQINIINELENGNGRGIGLFPMAIMFYELRGHAMLEYLSNQLQNIST